MILALSVSLGCLWANGPFAASGHMVRAGGQAAHWDIQNKEESNFENSLGRQLWRWWSLLIFIIQERDRTNCHGISLRVCWKIISPSRQWLPVGKRSTVRLLAVPFWIVERAREPKTHSAVRLVHSTFRLFRAPSRLSRKGLPAVWSTGSSL